MRIDRFKIFFLRVSFSLISMFYNFLTLYFSKMFPFQSMAGILDIFKDMLDRLEAGARVDVQTHRQVFSLSFRLS